MFSYCRNNPVNNKDPYGRSPEYIGDPQYKWAWDLGWWLKDRTDEEKEKIESGAVTYVSNEEGNGAHIENSYQIVLPWVMFGFIEENRGHDISGSTAGVVYEWVVHNSAHAVYGALGDSEKQTKAAHLDVGSTLWADKSHGLFSVAMQGSYLLFSPITALYDYIVEYEAYDLLYPRE